MSVDYSVVTGVGFIAEGDKVVEALMTANLLTEEEFESDDFDFQDWVEGLTNIEVVCLNYYTNDPKYFVGYETFPTTVEEMQAMPDVIIELQSIFKDKEIGFQKAVKVW